MNYYHNALTCIGSKLGFSPPSTAHAGTLSLYQAKVGVCGLLRSLGHVSRFPSPDWCKARVWEDGGKTSLGRLVLKIRTKLQSESIRASV